MLAMKLYFYGGARAVTGALYLLETSGLKILVDCGLIQGSHFCSKHNYDPFPFKPAGIDFLILTHAHIDHCGRIPKLWRDGFRGQIIATPPTKDLAYINLLDSQQLIERESAERNLPPLFSQADITGALALFEPLSYQKIRVLSAGVAVTLHDAGHILGSAVVELVAGGRKIIFSGDLGNAPSPFLNAPAIFSDPSYVVMESTYGDRLHGDRARRKDLLEDVIEETAGRGGTLMIPVFAIERTQEILFEINELVENHRVPAVPVFVDSPLAIKATAIYKQYLDYFNPAAQTLMTSGDDLFHFPGLKETRTVQESKEINAVAGPKIILAGSGMSAGGRIVHHERRYLDDPNNTILMVGYQSPGTLGRRLLAGERRVKIMDRWVDVKAEVRQIDGYSGHADQEGLLNWASRFRLSAKQVFVVQGEDHASQTLALLLRDNFGLNAHVPMLGEPAEL